MAFTLLQPANKAPGTAVVTEQTRARIDGGPGQQSAGFIRLPRPAESLPVGHLIEIAQLLAVYRQLCLDNLRGRPGL